jgi:PAS domain-containing protein
MTPAPEASIERLRTEAVSPRPAWLFAADGSPIWRNFAAGYFGARLKKSGLKLAVGAVPLKGQVARVLRLGSTGRTSLSRLQFLAGDRPASATCACTPLVWRDGEIALLVVGVDPIASDLLASGAATQAPSLPELGDIALPDFGAPAESAEEPAAEQMVEADSGNDDHAVVPADAQVSSKQTQGEPTAEERPDGVAPLAETASEEDQDQKRDQNAPAILPVDPGPQPVFDSADIVSASDVTDVGAAEPFEEPVVAETTADFPSETDSLPDDSGTPREDSPAPEIERIEPSDDTSSADQIRPASQGDLSRLSALMDRMIAEERLFEPIEDDQPEPFAFSDQPIAQELEEPATVDETGPPPEQENLGPTDQRGVAPTEPQPPAVPEARPSLYRVIGRYLRPDPEDDDAFVRASVEEKPAATLVPAPDEPANIPDVLLPTPPEASDAMPSAPLDAAQVERVSRYNFDELARILNDRVGDNGRTPEETPEDVAETKAPATSLLARQPRESGALINLGGETLVLNRLPLGILVFRDQTVLFANRAITDMVGFDSVEALRQAGLSAIFPGQDEASAGPVNHLSSRDGTLIPVTARLQSVSWQGRPALMLSASATEVRTGHETAVKAFAESMSGLTGTGFFEANRSGSLIAINARAAEALDARDNELLGKPLAVLIASSHRQALKGFLERPARFAETERPVFRAPSASGSGDVMIFAQGQAGLVTGYFGYVVSTTAASAPVPLRSDGPDPALLARLSRGLRRPLNTIIGFSDLIANAAFGPIDNRRYIDYARDIHVAGEDIAALVEELDSYARLNDGRYLPERASLDLLGLLESSVQRIRTQASTKRVILRTALSPNLPRVTADSASLTQAILNLLASAIDQTPVGAAVVISAQLNDDGGISVHVRDNSENATDLSERFVVFRDGPGRSGQDLAPVRSSVGLALTRSLLAVNAVSLSVDPAGQKGLLFSLLIPADLVENA